MAFRKYSSLESYKVPDRKKLAGRLLDNAYESVQKSVAPVLVVSAKYGSTLASYGWNNVHRRPILNFTSQSDLSAETSLVDYGGWLAAASGPPATPAEQCSF